MKIFFITGLLIIHASFSMAQNTNLIQDVKLKDLIQARVEENQRILHLQKMYGGGESWPDVKLLADYFNIDLTKEFEPFKHKQPVFQEKDFSGLPSGITFKKMENEMEKYDVIPKSDTQTGYLYFIPSTAGSVRFFFEQTTSSDNSEKILFFVTAIYSETNQNAIRGYFKSLTFMSAMGAHQMLRLKGIAQSDEYQFGDVCFVRPSPEVQKNAKRLSFFWVRDGVGFHIERPYDQDIDVVEFAKFIDDKFVEMTKALNPEMKDYPQKSLKKSEIPQTE